MKLGLIGYGAVAGQAVAALEKALPAPLDEIICLARPDGVARARALFDRFPGAARRARVVTAPGDLLAARPRVVAEAAGHGALKTIGDVVLSSGVDLLVTSVGALATDDIRTALEQAARRGGGRLVICAGAIGGLDILAAARLSGLREVVYVSRKPPNAWRGTPAENLINLDGAFEPRVFFEGDAARAAREYPRNANVAATIALKGLGFAGTRVQMIADPSVERNVHEIRVKAVCADFTIVIDGAPSQENPKTSMTTGFALANLIREQLRV